MALSQTKLIATVEELVGLLAARHFANLEALTGGVRLSAKQIEGAVDAYPGQVVAKISNDDLDIVEIDAAQTEAWSVNVRLHTDVEGPSDLALSLTLAQTSTDQYHSEIDDIHVL